VNLKERIVVITSKIKSSTILFFLKNLSIVNGIKVLLIFLLFFTSSFSYAQNTAIIFGQLTYQNKPIEAVNIGILGLPVGTTSDKDGNYELEVPADTQITVVFSHISYQIDQQIIILQSGERLELNKKLSIKATLITGVVIEDIATRRTTLKRIDPKLSTFIPTTAGGIEALLKTMPGVSSNNELSSQYNVRGGNYDENLVYVNDIEIYRPFLVRSGQQEGLSFINSDMVSSLLFSAGGFEARYGDKMSSVLDIQYRRPREFAGTASASLMGGAIHLEDASKNARFSHISGVRYRTTQYLLKSLDTKGEYKPSFTDFQTSLTFDITPDLEFNFLGNIAQNTYNIVPETRETDYGTLNEALRLTVFFEGQEIDKFRTIFGATSLTYKLSENTNLKFITSAFNSVESETFDILGQYRLDQLETDFGKQEFGNVSFNRGVGGFLNHARNELNANVKNIEHKGTHKTGNSILLWGIRYQNEDIKDKLNEWKMVDSAGYSLPQSAPEIIELQDIVKAKININSNRYTGYLQQTFNFSDTAKSSLSVGIRGSYWDLNKEFLVSPRITFSYKPEWKSDFLFRASSGYYYQPPFYRELRDFNGVLHKDVKAQKSIHFLLGSDFNFKAWQRPFKLVIEGYYKHLENLIPYEIDNVRLRYYANNNAHGYATGIDMKVNGEFVKGIESWASVSVMKTQEDIEGDFYYEYYNKEGERIIKGFTFDQVATDSVRFEPGYIPRPSDQRVNFSIFFQDYLPKLPSFKMHLNLIFGAPLPFGPPDFQRHKDILRMPPYRRVDIGFSYLLKKEEKQLSAKNPFKYFKTIWVSAEVFNLLQISNTVSYIWIKDVTDRQYAIPNYLTNRLLNIKLVTKF